MKKLWSLLALVLALALLVGSYVFVKNRNEKKLEAQEGNNQEQILSSDREKITKMILSSKNGDLVFEKKNEKWIVPGANFEIDQNKASDVTLSFSSIFAEMTVEEEPKDLAKYGLQNPAVTATAFYQNGEEKTVYLGNKTPVGDTYYLMIKGVNKVYTVWQNHGIYFSYTLDALRADGFEFNVDVAAIQDIKVIKRDGTNIEIVPTEDAKDAGKQYGFDIFKMIKPYKINYSVDTKKLEELVLALPEISISEHIEDNPKDLSRYGLDKPQVDLFIKDKNNKSFHILIGNDKNETLTYFKLSDKSTIYTTEKAKITALNKEPFELISKFANLVYIDDVEKIEIKDNNKSYNIELIRTLKKKAEKAGEEDEYSTVYKINGKEIEESKFKTFYQTLIGLTVDAESDKIVTAAPELTTTFYLKDNKKTTAAYANYNVDFYAVQREGNSEVLISKNKVKSVLTEIEELIK